MLWHNKPTLMCIISLLLLCLLSGSIYYFGRLNNPDAIFNPSPSEIKKDDTHVDYEDLTQEQLTDETFLQDYIAEKYYSQNIVTIVLLGFDTSEQRRIDSNNGFAQFRDGFSGARTDGIKLATINFDTNEASIISIPRDTYVPIASTGKNDKINAAYVYGRNAAIKNGVKDKMDIHRNGVDYTLSTLENLFDIPLDYYFCVDFDFIVQYIDYIGGIQFNVDHEVKINGNVALEKKLYDPANGDGELNGTQAFIYMQDRKNIANGDFGRIQGHTQIILATIDHLKNNPGLFIKSFDFMNEVGFDLIESNLSKEQILALANAALKLDKTNIKSESIDGYTKLINTIGYVIMKDQSRVEILKNIFGIDTALKENLVPNYIIPETPLTFTGSYGESSGIMLSWTAGDRYTLKYNLYRNGTLIGSELTDTFFTDAEYIIGLNTYTIESINGSAVCEEPATIEVLTKFDVDTPWDIRANYNASSNTVTLTWEYGDLTDVKFMVTRSGNDGSSKTFDSVTTTVIDDASITSGITYTYYLTAADVFGNTSTTVKDRVSTKALPTLDPTPASTNEPPPLF